MWDETSRTRIPILVIGESDPGSGYSHRYNWSKDSKVLFILGSGRVAWEYIDDIRLAYYVADDILYTRSSLE